MGDVRHGTMTWGVSERELYWARRWVRGDVRLNEWLLRILGGVGREVGRRRDLRIGWVVLDGLQVGRRSHV